MNRKQRRASGHKEKRPASWKRAMAHIDRGNVLSNDGRLEEAESNCRRALKLKPDYAVAHNNLGNVLWKQGRLEEAESSCRSALKLKPEFPLAHSNLGSVLRDQGRLEEAELSCRRAIELAPDLPNPHNNLGNVLGDQSRLEEAEASYRRALKLKPDFTLAHSNLASILRSQHRLEESLDRMRQLLQHSTLSPDLVQETEIVHDRNRFRGNDLQKYFFENSSQDLHKWHHYFEIYDQWFSSYRNQTTLRVLEIGVFRGGSLKMWRDYFNPKATIVGLDIDSNCKACENPDKNIFVEIGDQADTSFLEHVVEKLGPFDIIIDDGGHTTAQQSISFNFLYANGLNDGGVYLVEDLHTNYWPQFQDAELSFIDFVKPLVDHLHEPYFTNHSEFQFREGNTERLRSLKVSTFCANTQSISFYDSIIVFSKRRKSMPVSEFR